MRRLRTLAMFFVAGATALAATAVPVFSQTGVPTGRAGSDDIAVLQQQIAQQQKQIEQLRTELEQQQNLLRRVAPPGDRTLQPSGQSQTDLGQVASAVPIFPAVKASAVDTPLAGAARISDARIQGSQAENEPGKSPLTLRIGDADFTIGGFVDATAFFRTTNLGSGIGTSFGAIPFSNSTAGHLTETRFSAQNSRFSLMATSKVGANDVKGYMETDFLGFQPNNAFVTSNSNSLRLRLYWVELMRGKFEFLGGQSWSMLTPNRSGLSPMPSDLFYSQDMDTNYQVGLTWSRQQQFRFIYHASKKWTAGVSLENPQQFVGSASALPFTNGAVVLPSPAYAAQVDVNQGLSGVGGVSAVTTTNTPSGPITQISGGLGGGTATPNLHPDIIAKIAYDPTLGGKHMHVEAAGLLSSFKLYNPSAKTTSTATGGGGAVNLNLELFKNFHGILTSFYSDGGGRYIFGLGPDLIVKPDGTPSLVHAGSGIVGFEWQATKQTMYYAYYGGAYFQRNTAVDPASGSYLGFGFRGSSSSANRAIQEATFGIIQTFWKNPRYGALQLITQYSYLTRSPWSVSPTSGNPKNAHLSMAYADVRYVLP